MDIGEEAVAMDVQYKVTREGMDRLRERLEEAEGKLRKLLRQKQETAESGGDHWHDNPAFYQLEMDERALHRQIGEIHDKLARAVIVERQGGVHDVGIGSFVEVAFGDGRKMELTIVDPEIASPSEGSISYDSPLGQAILGARSGDIRTYSVAGKEFEVKVIRIGGKNGE